MEKRVKPRPDQVIFRVTPEEKRALEQLVQMRATETGDDTLVGWFRAVLRREARSAGIGLGTAAKLPDGCTCGGRGQCAACIRVEAEASLRLAQRRAEMEREEDEGADENNEHAKEGDQR
jgi:hypothetical protein